MESSCLLMPFLIRAEKPLFLAADKLDEAMTANEANLREILKIGHEVSIRGSGISLREALARTRYSELRPSFGSADLIPLIKANPDLGVEWIAYSEDKRTDGGWYVMENCEIGQVMHPESIERFSTFDEAVAEYVVRELDFWTLGPETR